MTNILTSEVILQPSLTSIVDHSCRNSQGLKVVDYFRRKALPQMFFWALNTPLYLIWLTYQKTYISRWSLKNTSTFKSKHSNKVYQIEKNFNCNSKMVAYLIECRVCGKQYNGSTVTKFCARANNYKSMHHNFRKEQLLSHQACNQKHFHEHYLQNDHNEICDWEVTIIDHAERVQSLRQKELY